MQALNANQRQRFWQAFENHNQVQDLCNDASVKVVRLSSFPDALRTKFGELTDHLFKTMRYGKKCAALLQMDQPCIPWHYKRFRSRYVVCPFCGLITYPSSGEGCADYDHYLDRANYPLSAANGENLVPMCERCNRPVKGQTNVIVANGKRRVAYYPYEGCSGVVVACVCLEPDKIGQRSKWSVTVTARNRKREASKVRTWAVVFQIEKRYSALLDADGSSWVKDEAVALAGQTFEPTPERFSIHLGKRANKLQARIAVEAQAILKGPLFEHVSRLPRPALQGIMAVATNAYGRNMRQRGQNTFR